MNCETKLSSDLTTIPSFLDRVDTINDRLNLGMSIIRSLVVEDHHDFLDKWTVAANLAASERFLNEAWNEIQAMHEDWKEARRPETRGSI